MTACGRAVFGVRDPGRARRLLGVLPHAAPLFGPDNPALAWALAALSLFVAPWLLILVHELAHASAGWLVGLRVREIYVGGGQPCAIIWLKRAVFVLGLRPTHGYVRFMHVRRAGLRWRALFAVAAGPIMNVVVAVGLLVLFVRGGGLASMNAGFQPSLWVLSATAALLAVVAWLPRRVSKSGSASDVAIMRELLRATQSDLDAQFESQQVEVFEFYQDFQRGDLEACAHRLRALEHARGDDEALAVGVSSCRSLLALATGECDAAVEHARAAAALSGKAVVCEAQRAGGADSQVVKRIEAARRESARLHEANLAFMIAHDPSQDQRAALRDATRLLSGVAEHDPVRAALLRTRAVLLIAVEQPESAIAALRQALRHDEPFWLRALTMACLAHAHAMRGETGDARKWLRRARRLHPQSPLLPYREQMVEAAFSQAAQTR